MDFLQELRWRGMLYNKTAGVEKILKKKPVVGYIGFDPTAPSITIGNYIQVMILTLFQKSGHKPIVLMGGATGRIGDPSGKEQERDLLSTEMVDKNLEKQRMQFQKLLNFEEGPNRAEMVNNLDFYAGMEALDFLRDVGKSITISYMLGKESVKNRIEKGISFTEFSYQLLQAYDFQCLFTRRNCVLQMGGSDQWGNITTGTEFIRRNLNKKAYAVTTPLLTKSDGSKFGKSAKGNIWLDPDMTSPYQFYQFWINVNDQDIPKFLRYFTLHSREEVEEMELEHEEDMNQLKRKLAEELTVRIHSQQDLDAVKKVSDLLFNKKADQNSLYELSLKDWETIEREIPQFTIARTRFETGINALDLLAIETPITGSLSEARRSIKENSISFNMEKIHDFEHEVHPEKLIHGRYLLIEKGKKNKYLVKAPPTRKIKL